MDVKGGVGREVDRKEIYASPGRHTGEIYTGRVRRSLRPPVFPYIMRCSPSRFPFVFYRASSRAPRPLRFVASIASYLHNEPRRLDVVLPPRGGTAPPVAKFHYNPEMRRDPAFFFKTELLFTTFEAARWTGNSIFDGHSRLLGN